MTSQLLKMKILCNEIAIWGKQNAHKVFRSLDKSIYVFIEDNSVSEVILKKGTSHFMVSYNDYTRSEGEAFVGVDQDRITISTDFLADATLLDTFYHHFRNAFNRLNNEESDRIRKEAERNRQIRIRTLERELSILKGERKEHSLLEK